MSVASSELSQSAAIVNECGVCGSGSSGVAGYEIDSTKHVPHVGSTLLASSSGNQLTPSSIVSDDDHFWIQCDLCQIWYHGRCVGVEEYESTLIESYHCPACVRSHATESIRKPRRNDHRYCFEENYSDKPTQVGTKQFIAAFKNRQADFPWADESVCKVLKDGCSLTSDRLYEEGWHTPYLVRDATGLHLKLPPEFWTVEQIVDSLGSDKMADIIDVYKQHTYRMSLGRFLDMWKSPVRERLYNIISLELSKTSLSGVVETPRVVRELSWVHRYWPSSSSVSLPSTSDEQRPLSVASTSAVDLPEHHRLRPYVSTFCLIGMADCYTDFHIDFGGSSVWYHVFKGEKLFYLVEPTLENLAAFEEYSAMPDKSEQFFCDYLSTVNCTAQCYRLKIQCGETLFIPSGWLHAVYTPTDSLVFGGNFLHSGSVEMQLKIYDMEVRLRTDERFMFPSFELTNWYAAVHLVDQLRDANHEEQLVKPTFLRGLEALLAVLKQWMTRDKINSKSVSTSFSRASQQLQKEINAQKRLIRKLTQKPTQRGLSSAGGSLLENRRIRNRKPSAKLMEAQRDSVPSSQPVSKSGKQRKTTETVLSLPQTPSSIDVATVARLQPLRIRFSLNDDGTISPKTSPADVDPTPKRPPIEPLTISVGGERKSAPPSNKSYDVFAFDDTSPPSTSPYPAAVTLKAAHLSPVMPSPSIRIGLSIERSDGALTVKTLGSDQPATTTTIEQTAHRYKSPTAETLSSASAAAAEDEMEEMTTPTNDLDIMKIFGVSSHGRVQKPSAWVFGDSTSLSDKNVRQTFDQFSSKPELLLDLEAETPESLNIVTADVEKQVNNRSASTKTERKLKRKKLKSQSSDVKQLATFVEDDISDKAAKLTSKKEVFKPKKGMATAKQRLATKLGIKSHARVA